MTSGSLIANVISPTDIVTGEIQANSNGYDILITRSINGAIIDSTFQSFVVPPGMLSRLAVFGQAGDDDIQVSGSITLPAWIFGDAGDDKLKGGAGDDVILGGTGNDLLNGGSGRDLLIGGEGADRIVGNADDDILIAGYTVYDRNQAALNQVMTEWVREDRNTAQRVATLTTGVGGVALNQSTVSRDNEKDVLTGSAGKDWFFFDFDDDEDRVTDLKNEAFLGDLEWLDMEL
jgi:Ca2+-binding RTX toxin-like protein